MWRGFKIILQGWPRLMSKKSMPKKTHSKREERRLRPEDFDEIDEFAAQRANIKLESEEESFDEYENFDEEAILNVPDEDDMDEDEEDFESEEVIDTKKNKKDRLSALKSKADAKNKKEKSRITQLAKDQFDSDEDILYDGLHREASDDEENAAALWGKNRKNYYAEDESADAVEEEAQEAKRLQKKKLASLKFDDFVTEDAQLLHRPAKTTSIKKKVAFDDLTEFEPEQQGAETAEADLSEEEMADFIGLLKDFKERLHLLRTQLTPLMQRAREGSLPSSSGLSFLQLKYHLMLGYCSSVVYYLMLKGRGGRVEGHPVIKRMIRFRLMLEKIRPLENKMKFQIENLLQAQSTDESGFKPNLDDMVVDSEAEDQEAEDGEESSNVYRAPKLAPVYYPEDDGEAAKQKRHDERRQKALSKSRLLAELRGELDDLPEEEFIDPVRMTSRIATDSKAQEREAYEEENFIRFQVSKKEKRRLEKAAKPLDELDDLDDFFGELDEINEAAKGRAKKSRKSESISAYLDQINAERSVDEPEPVHNNASYGGSDESEIEDDIPKISKKDKKMAKRQEKLAASKAARGPINYRPVVDGDKNAPRPASYNIIKNRGLTPSRSKEQRNPRVRQRNRYEKAVKKHSSARGGRLNADRSKPYSGETTGIRTNLSKSVRFN